MPSFVQVLWVALAFLILGTGYAASLQGKEANIPLTGDEKAFLAGRTIRIGVDSARPPFECLDAQGVYKGISAAFIQECARRLGLRLEVVPGLTVDQAVAKVEACEIDLIPKVTPTAERGKFLLFTAPYTSFPSVIVSRREAKSIRGLEDLGGLKIGVLKGLVVEELLRGDHPELPLVAIANIKDALLQLSTGKIDVFVDNLGTVTYNIDQLGLTNLKIAAPTPYTHDLAFGVRKDMPLLRSALNKALASLSNEERALIKNQWLGSPEPKGIAWTALLPYAGALAGLALLLLVRNFYLRKAVRERQRVQGELEAHARLLESQAQIKAQLTTLSVGLQNARTYEKLAEVCLSQLAPLTGMASGSLHILEEEEGMLRYAGGYGRTGREPESRSIGFGRGLVGQCARDRAPVELVDPQGLPFTAALGCGELVLHELLILPIQRMDRVLGVLALATPTRFEAEHRRLLEEVLPILALNLEILAGNLETQQLLERSRHQARILAEAEQKSRTLLDSLSVGMLLIDPRQGVIVDTNPVALRLIGCTREDLIGQPCGCGGCTRALHQCPALDRGEPLENAEEMVGRTAGRQIPVLKNVVPVVLGGQDFLLESIVDISAQKALEGQLRESAERLQVASNALVQSPVSVMITDSQGVIEYVNPKFEALSGYASEEILGQNPRFLKSGLNPPELYEALWTTILAGREWCGEICNRKKNGDFYWEHASISPIHGEGGRITHFVSVREDITERRRLDGEIQQQLEELERFARLTVDREERMIELKQEINALLAEVGQKARYTIVE